MWKISTAQIKEIYYSLISCRLFSEEAERMSQGNRRDRRATVYRLTHPQREQNKREKCCHGVDWLKKKKGFRCGLSKLDNRLSQNVQHIWQSYKVYREKYGKLESGIDSRRKSLAEVKIQRGIFQGNELSPLL